MQNDDQKESTRPVARKSPGTLVLLILCGAFILYLAGGQVFQAAQAKMLKIQFLATGVLQQTVDLNGILIKNELPVKSPAAGKILLPVKDGEKVRTGAPVASIDTGDAGSGQVSLKAPGGGLLCTHVDGLEEVLKPGSLDVLDIAAVEKIDDREKEMTAAASGQQVVKVIDNLMPLGIYMDVPAAVFGDKLAGGKSVYLLWEGNEIKCRVEWIRETSGKKAALLTADNYPDAVLHKRKVPLKLVTGSSSGFVAPSGAVAEKEGRKGIYIVQKQRAIWVEVQVQSSLAGQSVIKGEGLTQDTRYITNPRWVKAGDLVE